MIEQVPYTATKVESMDKLYTGKRLIEGLSTSVLEQFFQGDGQVPADQLDCVSSLFWTKHRI